MPYPTIMLTEIEKIKPIPQKVVIIDYDHIARFPSWETLKETINHSLNLSLN